MKTVRNNRMYRASGMNEYAKSGKTSSQLIDYFRESGKAKIREYQGSGQWGKYADKADDSALQNMYDEASAIGMGLLNMLAGEGDLRDRYIQGHGKETAADYARMRSGQSGMLDAVGSAVSGFYDELTAPGYEYLPASVQKHPIDAATRAFNRARMTTEERDALRR